MKQSYKKANVWLGIPNDGEHWDCGPLGLEKLFSAL